MSDATELMMLTSTIPLLKVVLRILPHHFHVVERKIIPYSQSSQSCLSIPKTGHLPGSADLLEHIPVWRASPVGECIVAIILSNIVVFSFATIVETFVRCFSCSLISLFYEYSLHTIVIVHRD